MGSNPLLISSIVQNHQWYPRRKTNCWHLTAAIESAAQASKAEVFAVVADG